MAQLKYTKVLACGTVAAVAGLSLATVYLYKRRGAKRAEQKKAAAKALALEDGKQGKSKKKQDSTPDACKDCRKEDKDSVQEKEPSSLDNQIVNEEPVQNMSADQNCNTGYGAKMVVEEPFVQGSTSSLKSAPPSAARPDPIVEDPCIIATSVSSTESAPLPIHAEDPCVIATSVSTTESTPPLLQNGAGDAPRQQVVEEPIVQAASTPLQNGVGMTNGHGDEQVQATNGVVDSPFQVEGQQPLSFDWASSVEAAEKGVVGASLASPTCSTHNG